MSDILKTLQNNPQDIFKYKNEKSNYFNELTRKLLDPIVKEYSVLDDIYIDGLDSSQVYGQTKMVLEGIGSRLLGEEIPNLKSLTKDEEDDEDQEDFDNESNEEDDDENEMVPSEEELAKSEGPLKSGYEYENESVENLSEESDLEENDQEVNDQEENKLEENYSNEIPAKPEIKKDVFGLNDGFFDIDEYNKQVLALENAETDEIDYFQSVSDDDDEEEEMEYYNDFYDKPTIDDSNESETEINEDEYENALNSARLDLFADEEEEEAKEGATTENLSSFEKQQRALQEEIAKLEAELVADKKWTMKGEINSSQRPKESLLDETELSFDRTAKPVPVITEEITETIEDLIRKRIRNEEFDDLPRRLISDITKVQKPREEVSETKSSKSLAELYEDEYNEVVPEEDNKDHEEISQLFADISHKLDALCSAHFIPKPHSKKTIDIRVTDNSSPSISMEDAQPLHVSNEAALAPQEIYKNDKFKSGLSYSKDELSREDKQRLRRANKRKKAKTFQQNKRQKPTVMDTLSQGNVTVIDKKGDLRDVKGNLKKNVANSSNNFKL